MKSSLLWGQWKPLGEPEPLPPSSNKQYSPSRCQKRLKVAPGLLPLPGSNKEVPLSLARVVSKNLAKPESLRSRILGSLGGAAVWRLPLAQGAILETQDRIPRRAPGAWSLLLPLPMSLPLSLSLSVTIINK